MLAVLATSLVRPASAATRDWISGNGNWSVAGNWDQFGAPAAGDDVYIKEIDGISRTVFYDYNGFFFPPTLNSLNIGLTGGTPVDTTTLSMTNTAGLQSNNEFVGTSLGLGNSSGTISQSAGSNTISVAGGLYLGVYATDQGFYNLSGTGSLTSNGFEFIGYGFGSTGNGGVGTFNQTGGSNTINGDSLYLGYYVGSTGNYTLGNGSLTVGGNTGFEYLGYGTQTTGTFTQSGGTNSSTDLLLGHTAGSSGTYILNGGSLTEVFEELVGDNGAGSFTQAGGTHSVTNGFLSIASGASSTGSYSLIGGSLTTATGVVVGDGGSGSFIQSGGTNTANGNVTVGSAPGSIGAYTLSAGTLVVGSGGERVGYFGTGNFNQTGGTHTITGELAVGLSTGSVGDFSLVAGSLTVAGDETIGYAGTGTFEQAGGTNTGSFALWVGRSSGSNGTYTLSAGSLSFARGANVGFSGAGNFIQSGGTLSITTNVGLFLGSNSGSTGNYTLGGNGLLSVNAQEYVGLSGAGNFIQNGGTNTSGNDLILGANAGASGAYTLNSGSLSCGNRETVGKFGTGTFLQIGGTNTIITGLSVASPSTGSYTLVAGSLTSGYEYIADSGVGSFYQSGGANKLGSGSILSIGRSSGSSGTYTLSGGTLSVSGNEIVGDFGTGNFNQSGGTNNLTSVSGGLYIGNSPGSSGAYVLSGLSTLAVNSTEEVGGFGAGTFNQTSGSNTINGAYPLNIGASGGSSGTYALSGGSTTVGGSVAVGGAAAFGGPALGPGGSGVLTVSGTGVLTVGGALIAYNTPGSLVNLSGGTINAGMLNFNGVPSLFNWTSGTLNLTSDVSFDSAATGTTTSAAFGSSLMLGASQTLMITGNETLGGTGTFSLEVGAGSSHVVTGSLTVNALGSLTLDVGSSIAVSTVIQNGGTINGNLAVTSFSQNGGTFNGNAQVTGPFAYTGGTFNGMLISQGSAAFSANFTATGGMENDGTMTITGPRMLTFNGPGLDNFGAITLALGQSLAGTAVINDVGGAISSSGTIAAPFTNFGTFTENAPSGTMLVTGFMVNYGYVGPITTGVGFRPTGGLDNAGTIQLNGGSISGTGAVTNDFGGLIQSGAGASTGVVVSGISAPLTNSGGVIVASSNTILNLISFAGGNVNGGEIRIQNAATLTSQLAFPNSGTVLLQGAAATLAGGAIANTGTISGVGRVSNVLDNAGVLQAVGGTLTLAGAGNTNDAATGTDPGGQIQVGTGCSVIYSQGLATNAGTIGLSGGTFDNNNRPMTNASTGFIIGSGTFRSGGLTNNGTVRFADNPTSVYGSVTTATPGSVVNLINNATTFFGPVTIADDSSLITDNATARFLATLSGSVTSQLANNGALALAGVSGIYGKVANQGHVNVAAGATASFYGPFSGTGAIANSGSLTFNSAVTTNNIGGTLTDNPAAKLVVTGGGALEIDAAPTLADSSSILVTNGSRLKFNVQDGNSMIGTGVTMTVSSSATLELAGTVSVLANGADRVSITNNSTAPGILVSGTHQQVGNIDGSGTTQVNAGSDLTANHIIQGALVIGGTSKNPALVTIDASDASGNPLSGGLFQAVSFTASEHPFGAVVSPAELIADSTTEGFDFGAPTQPSFSAAGGLAAVPEPSSLALLGLGILSLLGCCRRFRKRVR